MKARRTWWAAAICLFGLLAGCEDEGDPVTPDVPDPGTQVSFVDQVQPIFAARCTECHGAGGEGGLDLRAPQSYGNLVDVLSPNYGAKRVAPGDPAASVLVDKITGGGQYGSRMPLIGAALSDSQIQTIRTWVLQGAGPD